MTTKTKFVEELPSRIRPVSGPRHVKFVDDLKANPGVWALHPKQSKTGATAGARAHQIKTGKMASFQPATDFEAAVRSKKLYVRYVGQ